MARTGRDCAEDAQVPPADLVPKKCKKPEDVLIINAEKHFKKGKRQNYLTDAHIAKIIDTYKQRPGEADRAVRPAG